MHHKDTNWKILSLLPIFLILVCLTLIPLVNIFYNSFFDIRWNDGGYVYKFIGLQHYIELPHNKFYLPGLKNTVTLSMITVFFQMIFGGFLLAVIPISVRSLVAPSFLWIWFPLWHYFLSH